MTKRALRGAAITFKGDPFLTDPRETLVHHEDALVVVEDGRIASVGPYADADARGLDVEAFPDALIAPGFVDAHVHYPQTQIIGAFGEQLLDWLNRYTFVAEQDFADKGHADEAARVFLRELLRAGTT